MTMTLPVISNLVHCKGISTREQLYFRGRGGFVEFGKFQGLTLCFHDQTMKRSNFGKINQNVLSLSTRSMQMELKRNAIVFGKRSSVEVVDGWEENKELLEDHLNSLRHAITMDNPEAAIGVMDKLGSLPLNDELKESARDINELEDQLHELFIQVQQIIETGDEGTARELIDANYESVAEQLEMGIKGVEQAAMLDILAQLHMSLSDFKATKNLLEQIKKILAGVGNHEPLVDKILEHMGTMYTALEEPKEALPLYTRSLGIQEAVLGKNNPLLVNLLLSLANTYNAVDEGHKSIQLYHRAITILERRKGSESEDLVFPLTHLSHVLIEEGEFDEAENSLHRALGIMEKLHGENDGRVGAVTCVLARALCANGKVDDAVVLYEKGLQIMERNGNLSLDDPVLETTRTDLAELLHVLGSLVVPRDSFTVATLKKALPVSARAKIKYLGNPMMDNLKPSGALDFLKKRIPALFVALLPGSRAPEVYLNWQTILDAVDNLLRTPISNQMIFLVPIVPFLEIDSFSKTLLDMGWKFTAPERIMHDADDLVFSLKDIIATDTSCDEKNDILHSFSYKKDNALVLLIRGLFPDVASWADAGIAMAGTATEQLVGLGKPVFTIAGNGPQFTNDFANAQSRLLGNSIIPCSSNSVAKNMSNILGDNMYMNVVRRNGRKRMGTAGASRNIAEEIHHIIYE